MIGGLALLLCLLAGAVEPTPGSEDGAAETVDEAAEPTAGREDVTDVVNLGLGGMEFGPTMALRYRRTLGERVSFDLSLAAGSNLRRRPDGRTRMDLGVGVDLAVLGRPLHGITVGPRVGIGARVWNDRPTLDALGDIASTWVVSGRSVGPYVGGAVSGLWMSQRGRSRNATFPAMGLTAEALWSPPMRADQPQWGISVRWEVALARRDAEGWKAEPALTALVGVIGLILITILALGMLAVLIIVAL